MSADFDKQIQVAEEAARQAGQIVLEKKGNAAISEKAESNLVTDADIAAQDAIIEMIGRQFPEHGIIAEEKDFRANSSSHNLWIIDPLDGTNNFAHDIPHFSISIAYACSGQILVATVYDPMRDEMFTACRGKGAFLNNAPIRVSQASSLQEAIVATGFYYDRGKIMRKTLNSIERLFEANIHGIRRFGSAALDLCWVACGRFDAFFEYKLSLWDFAAGILIIEEAGGCCTNLKGEPLDLNSTGLAVSNNKFHRDFLAIVGRQDTGLRFF